MLHPTTQTVRPQAIRASCTEIRMPFLFLFFSARRFEGVKWVAVNLQENPEMLRGEFSSFVSHLITTSNDKQAREEEVIVTDRT